MVTPQIQSLKHLAFTHNYRYFKQTHRAEQHYQNKPVCKDNLAQVLQSPAEQLFILLRYSKAEMHLQLSERNAAVSQQRTWWVSTQLLILLLNIPYCITLLKDCPFLSLVNVLGSHAPGSWRMCNFAVWSQVIIELKLCNCSYHYKTFKQK